MNAVNQKIIDAIVEKSKRVCPESLALIGIYGSVATGDEYEKSDLDLLILIKDDNGWQLGSGFILDDTSIGYDIYCTKWDSLIYESECHHAQLAKLMDAKIVYVKDEAVHQELLKLREKTAVFLASETRMERVAENIEQAKINYADACLADVIGQVRMSAMNVIQCAMNAVMIYHGKYFKRGVKRAFEELAQLPIGETLATNMQRIAASKDIDEIRGALKNIILYLQNMTYKQTLREEPSAGNITGTYEEMYSNWRNKVGEAAANGNVYASYANMCSLQNMWDEIAAEVSIGECDVMERYNPDSLENNVQAYDDALSKYEQVYKGAGIRVKHYANADEFVGEYLN